MDYKNDVLIRKDLKSEELAHWVAKRNLEEDGIYVKSIEKPIVE